MASLISFLRAPSYESDERKQFVFIANILSLLFAILSLILVFILYGLFGWGNTLWLIAGVVVLFGVVIVLNRMGYTNAGRLLFCLVPVWLTLVGTLWGKLEEPRQSYIGYFDSRFILLITTILPAIVFELREWVKISVCLVSTFICLVFFDPIHNLVGVGYYQRGFTVESYYYINYVVFISFVGLLAAVFILKWRDQRASLDLRHALSELKQLNHELVTQNKKLEAISHEMTAQNEEMLQQNEELQTSHEMLEQANQLITEQRAKLQEYNLELERLVREKSADLFITNEELVKSNNELRQFSFTVSHNLRGPVARLLGLTNLVRHSENKNEIAELTRFIHQSANELDSILKDLSQIIDIRNDLYRVRERIALKDEWDKALSLVGNHSAARLTVNFEKAPYLYGIRPMLQSIFYNLVSNAFKYCSPECVLVITVNSYLLHPDKAIIELSDNGLGIDLNKQGENLFKLYKRFHHHVPGKGLGLYLVKTQLEIMGGRIEVESEPDKGTLFRMTLPVPTDVDKQVFFENDAAQLYFDANINNTVIVWKRNITSEDYHNVFENVLQTIKAYKTPGWIADLRNQGVVPAQDQQWFIQNVLKAAHQNGLKRIGTIGFNDPIRSDYFARMQSVTADLNVELRNFDSIELAIAWMKKFIV
ncbi:MAG: HAMP domain-containing histidine kinase [Flammeovirgaceae bacterium]|nr:MAG: HAMP domain-containing histidine kinase [Flammeovirgaceae bacterium]